MVQVELRLLLDATPLLLGKSTRLTYEWPLASSPGSEGGSAGIMPRALLGYESASLVIELDGPLVPAPLLERLNPLVITPLEAVRLPDKPAAAHQASWGRSGSFVCPLQSSLLSSS